MGSNKKQPRLLERPFVIQLPGKRGVTPQEGAGKGMRQREGRFFNLFKRKEDRLKGKRRGLAKRREGSSFYLRRRKKPLAHEKKRRDLEVAMSSKGKACMRRAEGS